LVFSFIILHQDEAARMASDFATFLIRSLLSKGCLRYETVEKTKDGLEARTNAGATGLSALCH
jgi:quinol monooxygenase YgiN